MKKLAILSLVAVAGISSAAIYDNGPFITNPTGGAGGAAISELIAPQSTYGIGVQQTAGNSGADDFTVTGAGWKVSKIRLYSYQTNATAYTITSADWSVTGSNVNGSALFSGTGGTNGGFQAYRVLSTAPTNTARPIYAVDINVNFVLNPGQHWLRFTLQGSLASGPWYPLVTPRPGTANGQQAVNNGAFAPYIEAGSGESQDFPFQLTYEVVPEPATMIALGAGIAAVAARRRRK